MNLSALTPMQNSAAQIALAAILAVAGFVLLLPRPKGRAVREGVAALIAAVAVFGVWAYSTFGAPMPDVVGSILFAFFSLGSLGFGTVLVVQKNPGRGAIAFAFVILSTCGLFLLLAAPFLMAATIIIYAGAIIVTFLFVLMLSHANGPSGENDRSREPFLGGLAGFAFTGLVLFTLYMTQIGNDPPRVGATENPAPPEQHLPAAVLTLAERKSLASAIEKLDGAEATLTTVTDRGELNDYFDGLHRDVVFVVGSDGAVATNGLVRSGSVRDRLETRSAVPIRTDAQARALFDRITTVRKANDRVGDATYNHIQEGKPSRDAAVADLRKLREEVLLLAGAAELPARNVGNLGYLLYTNHLLAVELAGTLLLVATIGAVAIAQRKGAAA